MGEAVIKLKAFIYRFSAIFGLSVYLADKEEQAYVDSLNIRGEFEDSCARGTWQGKHGFTTVWTWGKPWHKALFAKIKHAFRR